MSQRFCRLDTCGAGSNSRYQVRYRYEICNEKDYFGNLSEEEVPEDMLDLAAHIVATKTGRFEPREFITTSIVNRMDGLRRSLGEGTSRRGSPLRRRRATGGRGRCPIAGGASQIDPLRQFVPTAGIRR